jgi:hypothetical protein
LPKQNSSSSSSSSSSSLIDKIKDDHWMEWVIIRIWTQRELMEGWIHCWLGLVRGVVVECKFKYIKKIRCGVRIERKILLLYWARLMRIVGTWISTLESSSNSASTSTKVLFGENFFWLSSIAKVLILFFCLVEMTLSD